LAVLLEPTTAAPADRDHPSARPPSGCSVALGESSTPPVGLSVPYRTPDTRLLVEGRSNRQIAEQLFISGKTASVHVTNIMAKLGVHSRLEAAAMARRLGLDQPTQEGAAT
jgi:hypothetical protein